MRQTFSIVSSDCRVAIGVVGWSFVLLVVDWTLVLSIGHWFCRSSIDTVDCQ